MKPGYQLRNVFIVISLFVIYSCRDGKNDFFHSGLPIAKNSFSKVKNDSCWFSISVRGDSILISDYLSSCFIKDFKYIDSFVCGELKSGRLKNDNEYPINLLIDSMTPYPVVDKLIEELQLIGFQTAFFKTASKGFWLVFPEKDTVIQQEVASLYGQRFQRRKSIIKECSVNLDQENDEVLLSQPPPSVYFDLIFYHGENIDSTTYGVIEMKHDKFLLNSKPINLYDIRNLIYRNKKVLVVKMNKDNYYRDFVKIIDLIYGVYNKKSNDYSLNLFKKKYADLTTAQEREIWYTCGFSFTIMSFAEQNYIKNNKKK